ncbi:hypothetical protein [Candidatus Jidaibacter acanthamoebae]|nr:hypothetical protein [Candidatus Jidaibacter acanthamoeba]
MSNDEYQNRLKLSFYEDTINLLKENAFEAIKDKLENQEDSFKKGIAFGYYEVFHLFQQQAEAFNISLKEVGLDDIDPERDLLGINKR